MLLLEPCTFMENMYGTDTIYVSGTDGSGGFALDTIVVVVNSVNDTPTAFSLVSPEAVSYTHLTLPTNREV